MPIKNKDLNTCRSYIFAAIAIILLFGTLSAILLVGCTLSFQNITTVGEASDIVDTEQTPQIKTDAKLDMHLPAL